VRCGSTRGVECSRGGRSNTYLILVQEILASQPRQENLPRNGRQRLQDFRASFSHHHKTSFTRIPLLSLNMAPSFGSILPSRRPRAPNITIDESALEQGTVSSDANTTDPASNLDSVAIHQIDTNADNLVSDDMPMQALDAMKDDQLHLRVPKLFSHDNSSVSSFASVVQNPRLGMPRQTQRTWAMDCLNNNLEAVFGNDQKIPKTYGLSAEEQEQKLVEVANEKYQTRDYSFYRFERLTLMNVLHWQHKLIQHDDKLSDGTISSDSEVVWTDDTALAVLQDTLAYRKYAFKATQWASN
jgi:hypothetical protein